jgi:hydroxyethylthiazole kinase-like uncharacterized protein yjeF
MKALEIYLSGYQSSYTIFDKKSAITHYRLRDPFANKGNFGHALIIAGSYGKIGAALLASRACLAAGAGLLTTYLPSCGYSVLQTALPEAMLLTDENDFYLTSYPQKTDIYKADGIGPGIGTQDETADMLGNFLKTFKQSLVLDADALNIISKNPEYFNLLIPDSIITPHPREFDRLFGQSESDQARFELARQMAILHKIIIVLKGHFTAVFSKDGNICFNTSGNAGMAKGGSGDALTGIITSLLSQSYAPEIAAKLGVYLHGSAGDLAAGLFSEEAMLPTDLIQCLGKTFLEWKLQKNTV